MKDTLDSMKRLDAMGISWLGWEYKTYVRKTGYGDGLFDEKTGKMRPPMAKMYSRPYARAIAGTFQNMTYDDTTGVFVLKWISDENAPEDATTEVYLGTQYHYSKGYQILVTPTLAHSYWVNGNILHISTKIRTMSETHVLTVKPAQ